ncbi:MAG: hypothetical protein JST00_03340 [Deltaproteobacteria bacterium]|nr:hypothetical protein [Deltaproteobacteria bacterium]
MRRSTKACGFLLLAAALVTGCRRAPPAASTSAPVRLVGRFAGSRFAWSASSVVARVTGTRSVSVELKVPVLAPHTVTIDGGPVSLDEKVVPYTVLVDDRPAITFDVSPDRLRYTLVSDLDPQTTHQIRVVREVEAFAGVHELGRLVVDEGGRILEPSPPRLRLELVGDSIMCGYGVLGANATCPFTYATERATLAYPFLVARALDADLSLACWSGRGVYRNYGGDSVDTMPDLYERSLPEPPATAFGFDGPPPDAVVIALGTNDFLGGGGKPPDLAAYEEAYVAFLRKVRARRPAATIVVATNSPMIAPPRRATFAATMDRVIARRRSEGEGSAALVTVDLEDERDRVGCDGHPNAEMHAILAKQVLEALRRSAVLPSRMP